MTSRRTFLKGAGALAAVSAGSYAAALTSSSLRRFGIVFGADAEAEAVLKARGVDKVFRADDADGATGVRAVCLHDVWIVFTAVGAEGDYEPFFYAHPEIAASALPVLVLRATAAAEERALCWLRMFPDFIPVPGAPVGHREIVDVTVEGPGRATMTRLDLVRGTCRTETYCRCRPKTSPVCRSAALGSLVYLHWNLGHFCHGKTHDSAIEGAAADGKAAAFRRLFAQHAPDVAGFCEYSRFFDRAGGLTRDRILGDFADVDEGEQLHYQCNAMALWRGKFVRRERFYYPQHRQKTYFLAEEAEVNGLRSVFVTSHLDPGAEAENKAQIALLVKRFAREPRVVVAADFNVADTAWYHPFLDAGFRGANCAGWGTLPTHRDKRIACADAIDNVFVRGWRIDDVSLADYEMALSDHRALVCALSPES